ARDGHVLTLIGSRDENVRVKVKSEFEDCAETVLRATPDDDNKADVELEAWLQEDSEDETLVLDLNGEGSFDLKLDGAGWKGKGAYKNLTLNVLDEFSHYIDTDGNG